MNIAIQYGRRRPSRFQDTRKKLIVWGVVLSVFLLANVAAALVFSSKTYPRTMLSGRQVGSVGTSQLTNYTNGHGLHRDTIKVTYGDATTDIKTETLGIMIDPDQVSQAIHAGRAWPPLANFVIGQDLTLPVRLYDKQFQKGFATLQQTYEHEAAEGKLSMKDYIFVLEKGRKAVRLDREGFRARLLDAARHGQASVKLAALPQPPNPIFEWDAETAYKELSKQQNTGLTYYFTARNKQLTAQDIGKWYVPSGKTYELSDERMRAGLIEVGHELGIEITNLPQAMAATKDALQTHHTLAFSFLGDQR